jgi:hypothetical protein
MDSSGIMNYEDARGVYAMNACSFEQLLQLLNKQLDLDKQLEVYDHLGQCGVCHDAVYQLSRDQDGALVLFRTAQNHASSGAISTRHEDVRMCADGANAIPGTAASRSSNRRLSGRNTDKCQS